MVTYKVAFLSTIKPWESADLVIISEQLITA
jgi:hypothetical protein